MRFFNECPIQEIKSQLYKKFPNEKFIFNLNRTDCAQILKISYLTPIPPHQILQSLHEFTEKYIIHINRIELEPRGIKP